MFKTVSVLALIALSSTTMVSAQSEPLSEPSLLQTLKSVDRSSTSPLRYSLASTPSKPSPACETCIDANFAKVPQCVNVVATPGATTVAALSDGERKCFCALGSISSSTWSQGCVSDTLCPQATIDYVSSGLVVLKPQMCAASTSGGAAGSASGLQKSCGSAIAAAALAMGAAAVMF